MNATHFEAKSERDVTLRHSLHLRTPRYRSIIVLHQSRERGFVAWPNATVIQMLVDVKDERDDSEDERGDARGSEPAARRRGLLHAKRRRVFGQP